MAKSFGIALGVLMLISGAVWTFQGLGWIGGSAMSGVEIWATIGPIVAGLGLALVIVAVKGQPK
ncbi:hypothetical protein [Nocardioides daphniae]|uniref:Uncharacterized protein n=1 Tax=Nocardioides daphniae TaxID=402297 RepID=A0A4P7U8I3_9ACTN|nr:hypothetical protein [Nocardioides daphniae]QCC76316.1 hypothetical protein E2C04_02215 [Nocardioides daphniae]GGD07984.1 hypothetical protein GCM10007231_03430 [Nocardioides daphniae]